MSINRALLLSFFVLLTGFSLACSTSAPLKEFARGQQLEKQGKTSAALAEYQRVLPRLRPEETRFRSETYYRIGECLFGLDEAAEAYSAFQKATDADKSNFMAQLRLGELQLAAGSLDKAAEQARLVLASGTAATEALALLGAAAAASGDSQAAQQAFSRVLDADPSRVTVALALADIYNRADRPDDARAVLKKAAAAQPNISSPWLALGRLEEQEGKAGAAEQAYRKAVAAEDSPETNLRLAQFLERASRIPEAEQVLRRVDAQRPAMPTALPDFEVISGRAPNALDQYLSALQSAQAKPASRPSSRPNADRAALVARLIEADLQTATLKNDKAALDRARAHLEQYRHELDSATIGILNAELALTTGNVPLAGIYAAGAVALAPESAPAQYVLGRAKDRAGDSNAARLAWLAALETDPHFVPARLALASQALEQKDAGNAETFIIPAVQDEPANLRALDLFARTLLAQRRYSSAALIAQRALAVDNTAAAPHLVLGEAALQQQLLGEALVHFEQAVLLDPHSHDAMEGLTRVYRYGSITRPMLQRMEKAAISDPPSATLMEITGRLYFERGWYADAERCLQQAVRLDPQRSTAVRALARTFAATGRYEAAAGSAARLGGYPAALLQAFQAEERNDLGRAIQNYEAALRHGESTGTAANNLAWLYAQRGTNLERALRLAETARALSPSNPAVLDTLGFVRLRRREYSQAIEVLESASRVVASQQAAERAQLLNAIKHHLAEAYLRAGQPEQAAALITEKR